MRIANIEIGFQSLPLAAGGLHQPADADDAARAGRPGLGDDGPGQRPLPDRAQPDGAQARRVLRRGPAARRSSFSAACPEEMRDAAVMCEDMGAQAVDINMGCPVKKVTKIGGGSAMMTELGKTADLVRGMVRRDRHPGHREDAPRLGRGEHHGARPRPRAGGRRRGRGLRPRPHARAGVFRRGEPRRASAPSSRPCARSRSSATATSRPRRPRARCSPRPAAPGSASGAARSTTRGFSGAPSSSCGRASCCPSPGFAERIRVLRRHFDRYCEFYGEERGARLFRKVAPWYAKRFGPAKPFKQRILTIESQGRLRGRASPSTQRGARQFCDADGRTAAQIPARAHGDGIRRRTRGGGIQPRGHPGSARARSRPGDAAEARSSVILGYLGPGRVLEIDHLVDGVDPLKGDAERVSTTWPSRTIVPLMSARDGVP